MALFQNTVDYNFNNPTCTIGGLTGTWQASPITLTASASDSDVEDQPYLSVTFEYSRDNSNWVTIGTDTTSPYSIGWNAENFWDVPVWVRATANDGMENSGWSETGPFTTAFTEAALPAVVPGSKR